MIENEPLTGLEIAVIGMAGRFPAATNIDEYWENIKNGKECIHFFSDQELEKAGISPEIYNRPDYVRSNGGIIEGIEYFDADFFGYTPTEAELLDPQLRLFHECCWEALEDAGYDPGSYEGLIGLFGGAEDNNQWREKVLLSTSEGEAKQTRILLSTKDFVTARVSYKLDLKGPVFTLITGCSTALTSIHLASRSLIGGECDMALAGGVYVHMHPGLGRIYQEGTLESRDGHLRAFDTRASGTVFSSGAGVVVLKIFEDALADNDHIYAVIKGSAVNCDGNRKVNFTAPSVKGQVDVIKAAYRAARVEMETIGYLEAHGTGTVLGDPIEINALKQAFNTSPGWRCPIGSVKSNIGHLDVAAGAAGFIKTVLILKHKLIPPSLNFETPNPKLELEKSPFYVNTRLTELKSNGGPRRAAVSAFGFGGTNVHAVLEEAPIAQSAQRKAQSAGREYQLILLSAKTPSALDKMTQNLVEYFKNNRLNHGNHENPVNPGQNPSLLLADAAYTLQVGRQPFQYREFCVCSNLEEAVHALASSPKAEAGKNPPVVFMFSGQGSQYVSMGLEIYRSQPVFQEHMDHGFDILKSLTGKDFKEIFYPGPDTIDMDDIQEQMNDANHSGPIKFIFEYSLGKLLIHWGIRPHALMGHSFGEYTAACLAGVFSVRDALELALLRGELMLRTPPGGMMSIPFGQEQLCLYLETHPDISLAAVNSSSLCFVSGPPEALEHLEKDLEEKGVECMRINFPRAAHSHMMKSITSEFEKKVRTIKLQEPTIPFISGLTGDWLSPGLITDPGYWATHLEQPVRFCQGVEKLLKEPGCIFVQVGPDRGLPLFVNQHRHFKPGTLVTNLVRHKKDNVPDMVYLLQQVGALWLHGVKIDWPAFYAGEQRRRISLPAYPFEGKRYWIDVDLNTILSHLFPQGRLVKREKVSDWLYTSSWKRSPLEPTSTDATHESTPCLIFTDASELGARLAGKLEEKGQAMIMVKPGEGFEKENPQVYRINPTEGSDYDRLFKALKTQKKIPRLMIHLWNVTGTQAPGLTATTLETTLDLGLYSLLHIMQSLGRLGIHEEMHLEVITDNMQSVVGEEILYPAKATSLGAVWVIPLEYPNISCHSLDIILPEPGSPQEEELLQQLLAVFTRGLFDKTNPVMAIRSNHSWIQTYEPTPIEKPQGIPSRLRQGGVYLITGGLGGIGFVLAEHLVKTVKARLILTGRSQLPPRDQWQQWLDTHPDQDRVSQRIKKVMNLEKLGAEVLVFSADSADEKQMQEVVTRAKEQFGQVNGIIHTAGLVDYYGVIQNRTREMTENILAPKVKGTMILDHLTRDMPLDFFVICSSIASLIPGFGEVGYAAANMFIDAFAHYKKLTDKTFFTAVNWDTWQEVGAAVESVKRQQQAGKTSYIRLEDGIRPTEGCEVFTMILKNPNPQVVVSTRDLDRLLDQHRLAITGGKTAPEKIQETAVTVTKKSLRPRPALSTPYVTPANPTQQTLAEIWQDYFGIDRVGIHDDFFELGGDSLMATILAARVHKRMDVKIPLTEIFQGPTVEKLSQYIQSQNKEQFTPIRPVEKKEYHRLSPAQNRLFILHQLDPGNTSYNFPTFTVLDGDIDKERLERSLMQMIQRHGSLRTSFEMIDDESTQRIHETVEFQIEYYDLCRTQVEVKVKVEEEKGTRGLAPLSIPAARSRQLVTNTTKDLIRPFDLSQAPLLRCGLIKTEGSQHIFMLDMHHIITDGTSQEIFIKELMVLYEGGQLTELTVQYEDFAEWQNQLLASDEIKKQEEYWLKEFAGEFPLLDLPLDYPRPETQSFEGRKFMMRLSRQDTGGLNRLTRQQGVTMYMITLAVFNILLSRLSNQDTIIVGIATAGRQHGDLQHIIGMFVNTLPLKNYPLMSKCFNEFLQEIKQKTLTAFENQDYPFENLVEKLALDRNVNRNPLFDVAFSFQNFEAFPSDVPQPPRSPAEKIKRKAYPYEDTTAKFDLSLLVMEEDETLLFTFEYCTKLFKQKTIERFGSYFKKIVSIILNEPGTRLRDIEIISEEEKKQLLFGINDTDAGYPHDKTIHQLFTQQVERSPHHIALLGQIPNSKSQIPKGVASPAYKTGTRGLTPLSVHVTYKELHEKSNQLACLLMEKGVRPDTIVAILLERSVEMIVGILAILKAGGAYLPLDPEYPRDRIDFMLKDSEVRILLKGNTVEAEKSEIRISKYETNPNDHNSNEQNKANSYTVLNFEILNFEFISNFEFRASNLNPSKLAYIIYTSGSTGRPKGVMIDHRNVVRLMVNDKFSFDFSPHDVWTLFHSFCFDFSVWEMYGALLYGGKLVVLPKMAVKDTPGYLEILKKNQVTVLNQTPSAFYSLADLELQAPKKDLMIRYVIFGGEALNPARLKGWKARYPGTTLVNMYGITETTVHVTFKEITRSEIESHISNIGGALPTLHLYVVNQYLQLQPVGVSGELCVGGAGVGRGYLNRPELTAEKFVVQVAGAGDRCRWKIKSFCGGSRGAVFSKRVPLAVGDIIYRTGDRVRLLPVGDIEYLGRIDHQVQIRGFRVELGEIERELLKHHEVKECVVILRETVLTDFQGNHGNMLVERYLCAYYVAEKELLVHELRGHLSQQLPDYMLPSYFIHLKKIPLTLQGKIDKRSLPAPDQSRPKLGTTFVAPRSDLEKHIANLWKQVLNLDKVGIHDNFFDLGGNSIHLIRVNKKLKRSMGKSIPVVLMFRYPTIYSLEKYLKQEKVSMHISKEKIKESVNIMGETMQILMGAENE